MARMVLCSAKMAAGEAATGRRKAGGTLLGKEAKQVGAIPQPLTFWGKANTKRGPRCYGRLQRAREEKSELDYKLGCCWGLCLICSTIFHRLFVYFSLILRGHPIHAPVHLSTRFVSHSSHFCNNGGVAFWLVFLLMTRPCASPWPTLRRRALHTFRTYSPSTR